MSKNIVMQELTANRYEELYPKTNTQEIISSNTTINQFLGGEKVQKMLWGIQLD